MSDAEREFEVTFETVMPGQTKATAYRIPVKAGTKVDALAVAESKWFEIVSTYDVKIREIPKVIIA